MSALPAAAAYRAAQATALPQPLGGLAPAGEPPSFADAVARAMQSAVSAGRTADRKSAEAIAGEGDVTELALAITKAELALQTTVAVRDRLVSAYQEIMRMAI